MGKNKTKKPCVLTQNCQACDVWFGTKVELLPKQVANNVNWLQIIILCVLHCVSSAVVLHCWLFCLPSKLQPSTHRHPDTKGEKTNCFPVFAQIRWVQGLSLSYMYIIWDYTQQLTWTVTITNKCQTCNLNSVGVQSLAIYVNCIQFVPKVQVCSDTTEPHTYN